MIAVAVVALCVWWWLGVHGKSKVEQAAYVMGVRSGRAERHSEKAVPGGTSLASVGEYLGGAYTVGLGAGSEEALDAPPDVRHAEPEQDSSAETAGN